MSFVYLSQFYQEKHLIKIGFSKAPEKRLKYLSNFYGAVIQSYAIECEDSLKLEKQLHKFFKEERIKVDRQDQWYTGGRSGFTEFFNIKTFQEVFEAAKFLDPGVSLELLTYDPLYFKRKYFKGTPFKGFVNS